MHRRTLLAGLLATLSLPTLASAQQSPSAPPAELARIQNYLSGLHSLKARFLQIAPDGTTSQGTAWMVRPGRMRFQYDPPSPLLLVAGHGLFIFRDNQLRQTTNIPLDRTPLGILLADNIQLSGGAVRLTNYLQDGNRIEVTLVRGSSPGEGSLTLIFQADPLALREWIVTDAQRRETRISLFDVQLGGSYPDSLFTYVDPAMLQGGPGQ
jgi:outer membrane lipoprotein-sorting protein